MDYFIYDNITKLAANKYLEDLLQRGQLQSQFETDAINHLPSEYLEKFHSDILSFTAKYSNLCFNDFLFMRNVDILRSETKAILLLIIYGADCKLFVDRAVLRWVLTGIATRNMQRTLLRWERTLQQELPDAIKFSSIDQAAKTYILNMSFYRYCRNINQGSIYDGYVVDVNFFIMKILYRVKSPFTTSLFVLILDILKANVDYCAYLKELACIESMKFLFGNFSATDNLDTEQQKIQVKSLYTPKLSNGYYIENYDDIVNEILIQDVNMLGVNNNNTEDDNDDENDADNDEDDDNDDDDNNNDDSIEKIEQKYINATIMYFLMPRKLKKSKKIFKNLQSVLLKSCDFATQNKRFCVILYCEKKTSTYRLMTRQVKTARLVLRPHGDLPLCGWSGMIANISKTIIFKMMKELKTKYTIKGSMIYNVKNENVLINDITNIIINLENTSSPQQYCPEITSSVPLVQNSTTVSQQQQSYFSEAQCNYTKENYEYHQQQQQQQQGQYFSSIDNTFVSLVNDSIMSLDTINANIQANGQECTNSLIY